MSIETPFPVEGTITATEYGYSASLPCADEWLSETENGDFLQRAADRAAREYGDGTEVHVRFTSDRFGDQCGGFELLGPAEGDQDGVVQDLRESPIDIAVIEGDGDDMLVKAGASVLLLDRTEADLLRQEIAGTLEADDGN